LLGKNATNFYVPQIEPREKIEEAINLLQKENPERWMNLPQWNWCGICALTMLLDSIHIPHPPLLQMYQATFDFGVYKLIDGKIIGAYHKPLAQYIKKEFHLESSAMRDVTTKKLEEIILNNNFFIASVTPEIRLCPTLPTKKGGHLIFIFGIKNNSFIFHNSTGFFSNNTQCSVEMPFDLFEKYFSGSGIAVKKP
jgi:hypothetical protein